MRTKKLLACLLMLALLFPSIVTGTAAADSLGFQVALSPTGTIKVGGTVTVTVSLTGYTEAAAASDAIRGVQVDITNVDSTILSVASKASLVSEDNYSEDADDLSNKASYSTKYKRVRLLFALSEGTLTATQQDLLQVTFKVQEGLTESGSITLPVKVLIQTENNQYTLNDSFTITYEADSGSETPVTSVDVTWGTMSFTYTDGTWSPDTHRYEGGGWTDDGTGYVTVENTGTAEVTASFTYTTTRKDITGSFVDSDSIPVTSPIALPANETKTVHLVLDGTPTESLADTTIGTVTVTIGGE